MKKKLIKEGSEKLTEKWSEKWVQKWVKKLGKISLKFPQEKGINRLIDF